MKKPNHQPSPKALSKRLRLLYFLGFILAIATALPSYIESNFFQGFVSLRWVSLFFVGANAVTIVAILLFPRLIQRVKNYKAAKIVLGLHFLSLLGLMFSNSAISVFLSFSLLSAAISLIWINMDIFVEEFSNDSSTGRTRALYFTFINLGWILAPSLTSLLVDGGNYRSAYAAAALMLLPFYFIFSRQSKKLKDGIKYKETTILKTVKDVWNNHNLRGIFFLAFLLSIFYAVAVVYVPIYLHQTIGFSWSTLGWMFSLMLLPFIIFEIPAGWLADKYIGEKELLAFGFAILVASLLLFFGLDSKSPFVWAAALFFSRVGASIVEAMRESFFFKNVNAKEVSVINFFRTAAPLGYLFGASMGVIMLKFVAVPYLFLFLGIFLVSSFFFILSLKDSK